MKTFKELIEVKNSSAVFTFGRFNPPTTGHEKLIDALARQQSKNAGSDMFVYASHSNDPKKNPLPHAKKIAYMRAMFPKYKRNILSDKDRNVFEIATSLYNKGYRSVVMVVGSDRVNEFTSLLNKYNDVEGRHGYYNFNNIEVVSAGERDPDAEGVEGMSASKMRAAAVEGDYDTFKLGLPGSFKHGLKLFKDIRSNMGVREERDMGEMTEYEELRDAYLVGKIWNIGDLVEANGVEGNVVNRGTNYLSFCDRDGKVHKAWLHDIAVKGQNYKEEYESNPSDMELFSEDWIDNVKSMINRITHPKNYDMAIKDYVDGMKDKKNKEHSAKWAADVAKRYSGIEGRGLIRYIDSLVAKGKLPKELKAGFFTKIARQATGFLNRTFSSDRPKSRQPLRTIGIRGEYSPVVEVKQDPDIKDRKGTQPAKYYAKDTEGDEMSKSTKQARARHFAKYGKKDDDDDKNYKPAPGDAGATTKPSKHTLKFRQMFGEEKKITQSDLDEVEKYADRIFASLNIDVEFTKHFMDRVNDARNLKQITVSELIRLFKQSYRKYGKKIAKMTDQANAVINDMKTDINMPFVIDVDDKGDMELIAKTVMRKKNFTTPVSSPKLAFEQFNEQKMDCPPATQDVALNTKNRNATRDNHMYGPLNVKEPGDYWEKLAKKWDTTVDAAKKSKCGNCVAFDISPRMEECMPGSVSDESGRLGYCWMHHFKCHSARSCDTWATGGPIKEDEKSHEWQEKAFGKKEGLEEEPRISRKKGQPAGSDKHSDLYTDENPEGTIHGLGFKDVKTARESVKKIINSGRSHAHKIQAAIAMEQRARVMGKKEEAAVYRSYIDKMKEKTKEMQERTLTDKEKDDKEHNVMKLKKHMDTFKDRYGKDAKSVMYAIATRDAKKEKRYKEEVQLDEKIKGLINKSEKSGISYSILKKVYDRGMAAWKTGHRPGTTPQQWAFARVNSFITKGKGTWGGADKDLARQVEMVESVSNINEWGEVEEEAEYQGRKVKLNNPMKGDIKKTKVYVRNDKGNVVKVEFGDPNMEIKRDDPERRKSFRARHNCDNPGPKWKARYWSCKFWEKGKTVTDLMKG